MVATIGQFIGKINPDIYAENKDDLIKKYGYADAVVAEDVKEKALVEHKLIYDSSSETLEPVYFFILDLMNDFGLETEKLLDNFASSAGSGHFAELGQRATVMQQQGTKLLGDVNTVLRSVLNIIYDLKEFRIRLQNYDDLRTEKKAAATLALKQIWLDKVDITKGQSSIKAMALGQAGFQTLIDAFLFVQDSKQVESVDLNDRVKRIIHSRILEFNDWLLHSEKELRKRYELEKNYLASQVNSLKLYARWAKPYLKAAQELEMKDAGGREPALVKAFNTIILELTLLGKKKINIHEEVLAGNFPRDIEKLSNQVFYSCVLVNFRFRGIPQRVSQQSHYVFGGRAEVSFKGYVLTEAELQNLNEQLDASDLGDVLRLIEGSTGENISRIQEEISFFLDEKDTLTQQQAAASQDSSNPFLALFGKYDSAPKPQTKKLEGKKEKPKLPIKKDNYVEKEYIRKVATKNAEEFTFKLFDTYKKAHGMPSYT